MSDLLTLPTKSTITTGSKLVSLDTSKKFPGHTLTKFQHQYNTPDGLAVVEYDPAFTEAAVTPPPPPSGAPSPDSPPARTTKPPLSGTWTKTFDPALDDKSLLAFGWPQSAGWTATPPQTPDFLNYYDPANYVVKNGVAAMTLAGAVSKFGKNYASTFISSKGLVQQDGDYAEFLLWLSGPGDGSVFNWIGGWGADGAGKAETDDEESWGVPGAHVHMAGNIQDFWGDKVDRSNGWHKYGALYAQQSVAIIWDAEVVHTFTVGSTLPLRLIVSHDSGPENPTPLHAPATHYLAGIQNWRKS